MRKDLFNDYPNTAGFRNTDTSKKAAKDVNKRVSYLQLTILDLLQDIGDMTADECAKFANESVLTIRPRFSELKLLGKIKDTEIRRKNDSGKTAAVFTVKNLRG